jgi:hypothetical protein
MMLLFTKRQIANSTATKSGGRWHVLNADVQLGIRSKYSVNCIYMHYLFFETVYVNGAFSVPAEKEAIRWKTVPQKATKTKCRNMKAKYGLVRKKQGL